MSTETARIPALFRQTDTGKPFGQCLLCHRPLLEKGTHYLVEKAIRNYPELKTHEVIFEYAMCFDCAVKMREELSEESRQRMDQYFAQHVDFAERRTWLGNRPARRLSAWVSRCVVKQTPLSRSTEYAIYAHCEGPRLVYGDLPYALSGEAMDEMVQLLSNKSLGLLDDFIGKYFSGPPEVRELLRKRPLLV